MNARNIMEEIVQKYMNEMLAMRFDVCTCDVCKQDILAYVLSRVPARYVTTESGAMHTMMEQLRVEQSSQILKELVKAIELVTSKPRHEIGGDQDAAYTLLMEQIKLDRGVDFSHYRDRVLKRRIALRMRARNAKTYSEYLQVLTHDADEYEELFDVLTINVSSFFRDTVVWDMLRRQLLPKIIAAKQARGERTIRVWSAGCAHGEEPYSLAMTFYELLEHQPPHSITVEITATDIDKESLRLAQAAQYESDVMANVDPRRLQRFFIPVEKKFQVAPQIKEMVKFRELNLIHQPGINGVDLILCRNVFIYFNRSLQEHLIMKFHESLAEGGYFVMGNSETMLGEARQVFESVDMVCRVYQKINLAAG